MRSGRAARKRSTSLPTSPGNDQQAVALAHQRPRRHAVDRGFFDTQPRRRSGPAGAPKARPRPNGQRAGDDAERRAAPPARLALLPQRAAGAHHPAPERGAAEAPAGEAAAHRRAEQHAPSAPATSGWRFSISRTRTPPRLWPTKCALRRARSAPGARRWLRAGCGRGRRKRARVARPREPRAQEAPSPRPASTARAPAPPRALHSLLPSRAKMALARTIGFRRRPGSSWRTRGASPRAGSRPPIRSSRRCAPRRRSRRRDAR